MLSIQSLLSPNPYTLEPGFEGNERANDTENMEIYKSKVGSDLSRISFAMLTFYIRSAMKIYDWQSSRLLNKPFKIRPLVEWR